MQYHLAVDSCTDMTPSMKADEHVTLVPLSLHVGEDVIIDDETFDQGSFLKKVAACPDAPSSACPSPQAYMQAFGYDDLDAYGITLSAELSGSYNSAELGRELLLEEFPNKNIHVFNSRSACCGQSLILLKIQDCIARGMQFAQVVETVEKYIDGQNTMFVLESLETLRKNGRLSGMKARLVNILNVKPVIAATPIGNIEQVDMGRGVKKALLKMIEQVGKMAVAPAENIFAISHCNCLERAKWVKEEIEKRYHFKDVIIIDTAGVGSMYASDGGIVIAF